jgi:pyroglutamyl-peptidase
MKKILVTGFEPFGGEEINPSWEAVKSLPSKIKEYSLTKLQLPVVFGEAARMVLDTSERICPDVILCIGQAGGRAEITPELVAINIRHAQIPDNIGNQPEDEPILEGAPAAYFSTIPVRKIAEVINVQGIASKVSYSAGAYVCNDLLYTLLARYDASATRVGFIHVPYSTEQGKTPSMELEKIIDALVIAIENLE